MVIEPQARQWERIEEVQQDIRARVFRTGMAGRLHVGRATAITKDPALLGHVAVFDDDGSAAAYLKSLPELIEQTKVQDARCSELWEPSGPSAAYHEERDRLTELFMRFQFRLYSYERLARLPQKPILEQAKRLLAAGAEAAPEARGLERTLQMSLREFADLEGKNADSLRLLEELRAPIIAAYEEHARTVAAEVAGSDPEATGYALRGLRKAAEHYSPSRGYRFLTYARWWIGTAVREKKSWQ